MVALDRCEEAIDRGGVGRLPRRENIWVMPSAYDLSRHPPRPGGTSREKEAMDQEQPRRRRGLLAEDNWKIFISRTPSRKCRWRKEAGFSIVPACEVQMLQRRRFHRSLRRRDAGTLTAHNLADAAPVPKLPEQDYR